MSQAALAPTPQLTIPAIPVREILPWAVFVGLLALIAVYFVSSEQGAFAISGSEGSAR